MAKQIYPPDGFLDELPVRVPGVSRPITSGDLESLHEYAQALMHQAAEDERYELAALLRDEAQVFGDYRLGYSQDLETLVCAAFGLMLRHGRVQYADHWGAKIQLGRITYYFWLTDEMLELVAYAIGQQAAPHSRRGPL